MNTERPTAIIDQGICRSVPYYGFESKWIMPNRILEIGRGFTPQGKAREGGKYVEGHKFALQGRDPVRAGGKVMQTKVDATVGVQGTEGSGGSPCLC